MEMQTTNTRKGLLGYTTPGSLTSLVCVGLVIAGTCFLHPKTGNLNAAVVWPSVTTQNQDVYAVLSQDIRAAGSVENFQPNQFVLAAPQGNVTYTFDPAAHTLTRTSDGKCRTLLASVESFSVSLLRRPGSGMPFGALVPANLDDARAISCRWSCSRSLAGAKLGPETFRMAPVLMRNR